MIERIIQSPPFASGRVLGASTDETAAKLSDLQDQINASRTIPSWSSFRASPALPRPPPSTQRPSRRASASTISPARIVSNITVSGVSGLTDADIPDGLTASNYLPLTGGTVTGTTTLTTALGIGANDPSSQLTLQNWTVTSPITWSGENPVGGNPHLLVKGTLDGGSLATGDIAGGLFAWNTTGAANNIDGLMLRLQPGYAGSRTVRVIDAQNLVAGASTLALQDIGGVIGIAAESRGTSTGDNVGIYSIAGFATGINVAGLFRAYQDADTTPGTNIGILSVAGHYGDNYLPTPIALEIGGYFSIGTYYDPRLHLATSSALIADNGNMTAAPVFIGRVNGFDAFQITGTGGLLDQPSTDATNFWQVKNHSGSTLFDIDSTNGRLGIGTSSPSTVLHVVMNNGDSGMYLDQYADRIPILQRRANGTPSAPSITLNGNLIGGLMAGGYTTGFTGARAKMRMVAAEDWNSSNQPTYIAFDTTPSNVGGSLLERMRIDQNGNVGIGTTTPWRKLSITGTVGFDGLGSTGGTQTLCLTDNKEVVTNNGACTSSSQELKHDISLLTVSGTDTLTALKPVAFTYNNGDRETWGFIAEDLAAVDPHFIDYFAAGKPRTINTTSILSLAVKAVQELIAQVKSLAVTVAGFADHFTTKELTFTRATSDEIDVKRLKADETTSDKLCVGSTCITESQLAALLSQSAAAGLANPSPTPIADSPPLAPEEPEPFNSAQVEPTPTTSQ